MEMQLLRHYRNELPTFFAALEKLLRKYKDINRETGVYVPMKK